MNYTGPHLGEVVLRGAVLLCFVALALSACSEERNQPDGAHKSAGSGSAAARGAVGSAGEAEIDPKVLPLEDLPTLFGRELPGTTKRECVEVNSLLDETGRSGAIRSGELVAGPFPTFIRRWVPNKEGKKRASSGSRLYTPSGCRGS